MKLSIGEALLEIGQRNGQPIKFLVHWSRNGPPQTAVCKGSLLADLHKIIPTVVTSELDNHNRKESIGTGRAGAAEVEHHRDVR